VSITIKRLDRRTRRGMMASLVFDRPGTPDVDGWYAEVDAGYATLECSRLDGESGWIIDALWRRNGMPVFSNGFGARYTMLKQPAAEIIEVLDRALDQERPTAFSSSTGRWTGRW
jgi:hypothetical protein